MSSISKQLQEHTKDTKSLRTFLDFLIKNKIYDSSLYLENLKDFDNNNLLLKACIYRLHNQLDQLVPHLEPSALSYKNNKNVSLAHQYYVDTAIATKENLKTITYLAQIAPASFANSPQDFSPFSITSLLPGGLKTQQELDKFKICFLFCQNQTHKLNHLLYHHVSLYYIYYNGLKNFDTNAYANNPSLINYFFHSFCSFMVKDIKPTMIEFYCEKQKLNAMQEIEKSKRDFKNIILKNAHYAVHSDCRDGNLLASQMNSSFLASIISSPIIIDTMQVFNDLAFSNPQWLKTLDFNGLGVDKNSLIHMFINCVSETSLLNPEVCVGFDTILSNCHHLNTNNSQNLDPYDFALSLGKPNLALHIKTFIEKKIITGLVPEIKPDVLALEKPGSKKSNKI